MIADLFAIAMTAILILLILLAFAPYTTTEVVCWFGRQIRYVWNVYIRRFPENVYFALPFGARIRIDWPVNSLRGHTDMTGGYYDWLTENVGKHGFFWRWRIDFYQSDVIEVKILKSKEATLFALMCNG